MSDYKLTVLGRELPEDHYSFENGELIPSDDMWELVKIHRRIFGVGIRVILSHRVGNFDLAEITITDEQPPAPKRDMNAGSGRDKHSD